MPYFLICPIGVIGGKQDCLTYDYESALPIGTIVKIPFGKRSLLGVVISEASEPTFKTKSVTEVLEHTMPSKLIALATWMSEYYATRLSLVLQAVLPSGLNKKRRVGKPPVALSQRSQAIHKPTDEQKNAVATISSSKAITHLLHGVTGSGKTWVYQRLTELALKQRKSVLILVPEIALTPQLAAEFQALHDQVLILHSQLSEAQRHTHWQQILNSPHPWVVIGPRSALFSPLSNIGLIVIDECHEPSYQQDSQPKYSALRVGRKLAEIHGECKLILGSATPNVSDYYIATKTKTPIIRLSKSINGERPVIQVVDMRESEKFGSHQLFSSALLEALQKTVADGKQVLLFHNRRGTARLGLCSNCGWVAECPTCHIPFRLHHDVGQLRCHTCGRIQVLPQVCPTCSSPHIDFKGFGSKRIEQEVRKLYPQLSVARFDSDTPLAEQLHARYQELYDNKIQIIIGTQTVAKGLDLPHLDTVGVVQADSELFIPDFSSTERSFQLITQVIGRVGRNGQASSVIIQTFNPDHPSIRSAIAQDYKQFYDHEITERQVEHVSPFSFMLQMNTGYKKAETAQRAGKLMREQIKARYPDVIIRGPSPAFHEHRGVNYYWQLVLLSHRRNTLVEIAKNLPSRWQFQLDPLNLL